MSSKSVQKTILKYQWKVNRSLGRPLKWWKERLVISVTGFNRPNTGKDDDNDDDDDDDDVERNYCNITCLSQQALEQLLLPFQC
jgi:hypothetical protein